jgi:hypothetical protein
VLRRVEARCDGADHLTIDNDRKPSLHFREALCGNGSNATVVDRVLKRLTRLLEQRRCSSLAGSKFHAGEIGGMVHALDQDRPSTIIDYGDNSGQVIAHGLRFRGDHDLSRNLQGQHLFSANWAVAAAGSNTIVPNSSPRAMAMRMVFSSSASRYSRIEALN